MIGSYRHYEILLPLRFNDGKSVPDELIGETLNELQEKFGAVSFEPSPVHGIWESEGRIFTDHLARLYVDIPDTAAKRRFFRQLKARLKSRFQQIDIWITTHPIEVL